MRVVVVGAGLSGLVAARRLRDSGHDVVVFDKGRSPGGRLATRRIGHARVDHGAQFFTVRDDAFDTMVNAWRSAGLVHDWCRGFGAESDGFARYSVNGGMTALAKHLATGIDVRCSHLVFTIRPGTDRAWQVVIDDGAVEHADAVIVTCPLPQSYALLVTAEVEVPEALFRTEYDRTLCLLAVLDRPSAVPAPGGVQGASGFTFIADNQAKGISDVPALTLHADPAWSADHWADAPADAHSALLQLAAPWSGDAQVTESQLKRWTFATPRTIWPDRCWQADAARGALIIAGDAFAGPRVEGAALSGAAAAEAVLADAL